MYHGDLGRRYARSHSVTQKLSTSGSHPSGGRGVQKNLLPAKTARSGGSETCDEHEWNVKPNETAAPHASDGLQGDFAGRPLGQWACVITNKKNPPIPSPGDSRVILEEEPARAFKNAGRTRQF